MSIPSQPPQADGSEQTLGAHVLRGRVTSASGAPLALAHVHLMSQNGKAEPLVSSQTNGDGTFAFPLTRVPDAERIVRVQFSGVDHRVETAIVSLDEVVEVDVKLGTYRRPPPAKRGVGVMVFAPNGGRGTYPLDEAPDGTYVAELPLKDGKYGYEVTGFTAEGHTINGTVVEDGGFQWDDDGDYESVVNVTGGKLRVVFDPKKLPPAGVVGAVQVRSGKSDKAPTPRQKTASASHESVSALLTEIYRRVEAERGAVYDDTLASDASPDARAARRKRLEERANNLARSLEETAAKAKEPIVRVAASIASFEAKELTRDLAITDTLSLATRPPAHEARADPRELELASDVLDHEAEASLLWTLFPAAAARTLSLVDSPKSRDIRARLIERHPNVLIVANLHRARLHALLASTGESGPDAELRDVVRTLHEPRFRGTMAQVDAELYDPDRVIAPGKPMPSFDVPAIAAKGQKPSAKRISSTSLAGKVYLLDLWATWCKPCVGELPRMHEIYAKYGGAPDPKSPTKRSKQFEILSVSVDDDAPKIVPQFRTDKAHPMPWLNGHIEGEHTIKTLSGTASRSIPYYVLVDDHGNIIASSPELRLDLLPALLDRLL